MCRVLARTVHESYLSEFDLRPIATVSSQRGSLKHFFTNVLWEQSLKIMFREVAKKPLWQMCVDDSFWTTTHHINWIWSASEERGGLSRGIQWRSLLGTLLKTLGGIFLANHLGEVFLKYTVGNCRGKRTRETLCGHSIGKRSWGTYSGNSLGLLSRQTLLKNFCGQLC